MAFGGDSRTLAAGLDRGDSGGVMLWDLATRSPLKEPLLVPGGPVRSVSFSGDGKTLAAGFSGRQDTLGGVMLWDTATYKPLPVAPLSVPQRPVPSVSFSADGKMLAAGLSTSVMLWNAATWERPTELPVGEGRVSGVAFSSDDKILAAGFFGGGGGGVKLWNTATLEPT